MSVRFDLDAGLIVVNAELVGSAGSGLIRLALDTGATATVVNVGVLVAVGYDPSMAPERVQVTTGSGVEYAPRVTVMRFLALGQERRSFPVLCHTLPLSTGVDGCSAWTLSPDFASRSVDRR